jgi:hypothetical protein
MTAQQNGRSWNPFGSPGGNTTNTGVFITGDAHGPIANGQNASAVQGAEAGNPVSAQALRSVADALQAALRELRAQQPDAVAPADATDAERALDEIVNETQQGQPDAKRLRRWADMITSTLGGVTALATSVASLEHAVRTLGQ